VSLHSRWWRLWHSIGAQAGWAPEPIWERWWLEKSLPLSRIELELSGRPTHNLANLMTKLLLLWVYIYFTQYYHNVLHQTTWRRLDPTLHQRDLKADLKIMYNVAVLGPFTSRFCVTYHFWTPLCNVLGYWRHRSVCYTSLFTTSLIVITISFYNVLGPSDVVSWSGPFISLLLSVR
jgi:hypothetical protein